MGAPCLFDFLVSVAGLMWPFGFKGHNENFFPLGHLTMDRKTFMCVFSVYLTFCRALFCVFVLDWLLTTMGQVPSSGSLSPFTFVLNHFGHFKDQARGYG